MVERQLAGKASWALPLGRVLTCHEAGGGPGWSQAKACGCIWAGASAELELTSSLVVEPPQAANAAALATANAATIARATRLDVAIAVARPAVVVGVMIAAVVLRDPSGGARRAGAARARCGCSGCRCGRRGAATRPAAAAGGSEGQCSDHGDGRSQQT